MRGVAGSAAVRSVMDGRGGQTRDAGAWQASRVRRGQFVWGMLCGGFVAVAAAAPPASEPVGNDPSAAEPLPFPIYVAGRIAGPIRIDGELREPPWRQTALGWGTSNAHEPNTFCPDPTLFRIGYDKECLYLALACYQRDVQDDIPDHVWKPRETELMDTQAIPRHARERGVAPPINVAQVLISHEGRTVVLTFEPPKAPTAAVHDSLGEREFAVEMEHAYRGTAADSLWVVEARVSWDRLGFPSPAEGDNWALNVYREIRFLSTWSFIAWMREWNKVEYSRFDLVDRFGRLVFAGASPDAAAVERLAARVATCRGPVRVFLSDALLRVDPAGKAIRQRYADRLKTLRAYAEGIHAERQRISNDLPYYPFFPQTQPGKHLNSAGRKIARLREAANEKPLFDDPACAVARISHAIPEARDGLSTYRKERLYRGLPE